MTIPASLLSGGLRWAARGAEKAASVLPGAVGGTAARELGNRLEIFRSFQEAPALLRAPGEDRLSLGELVSRAESRGPYRGLWTIEGAAYHSVLREENRWGAEGSLLRGPGAEDLPLRSLVPVHAGLGLAFAVRLLDEIPERGAREIPGGPLERFVELCRRHARPGWEGVAIEELGLATRTLRPDLASAIDAALGPIEPLLRAHFWHGVGRGLYFLPTQAVPWPGSGTRVLAKARSEAPDALGRANSVAGLAWALTLSNLRHPVVVSSFLARNVRDLGESSAGEAFAVGTSRALLVWAFSVGEDRYLRSFLRQRPPVEEWERLVVRPGKRALERLGDLSTGERGFGELFRWVPESRDEGAPVEKPRGDSGGGLGRWLDGAVSRGIHGYGEALPSRGGATGDDLYDVVVLGAGLAGLTLARQLLLETDRTVLVLERRGDLPPERQKVGESTVQLAGYYLSRVLDLEEHLNRFHLMKYNLRFYWPAAGRENRRFEDYGHTYIRGFSNVAGYQVDRNRLEAELLRRNRSHPRFRIETGIDRPEVALDPEGPHRVRFRSPADGERSVSAEWVVDATGRRRFLVRELGLERRAGIRHGAFFWWVDGLVDVERLTDRSRREVRLRSERSELGHLPAWLATNHFCGEGFWFWVIPLQGKTSLGLVYDPEKVSEDEVFSVDGATRWIGERFPLFAGELARREVLDFGGFRSYAHDCTRVVDSSGWALTGEAGRFHDPLYSPASDLIALHNTVIVDLVEGGRGEDRAASCRLYDRLLEALYRAYLPSFRRSYDALGDQETFALKYGWELTVYFGFYVFPFLNDLFTDRRFVVSYLRLFSRLGPINDSLHGFLSGYFQWKKGRDLEPREPIFFDLTDLGPLRRAERTFYRVGVSVDEARTILREQFDGLEELARLVVARAASVVLGDSRVVTSRSFVEGIEPSGIRFDPEEMARRWRSCRDSEARYPWSFDPSVLEIFDGVPRKRTPARGPGG